jgi:hypothetical protein
VKRSIEWTLGIAFGLASRRIWCGRSTRSERPRQRTRRAQGSRAPVPR